MGVDRSWMGWFRLLGGVSDKTELKNFCNHLILDFSRFDSSRSCDLRVVIRMSEFLSFLEGALDLRLGLVVMVGVFRYEGLHA